MVERLRELKSREVIVRHTDNVLLTLQSLSKFNLPVTLPNGRGMGMGSGPMTISSGPILPSNPAIGSRGARVSQEPSVLPIGEVSVPANEPDLYDPDQPLWNKDRIGPSGRITKLPSFHKGPREQVWEGDAGNNHKTDRSSEVLTGGGASDGGMHGADVGSTVWDRIGPVDRSAEGRPSAKDRIEDQQVQSRGRGLWPGKWERQLETPHVHAVTGRGRGVTARGEVGLPGQRAKEGSSFGSRSTIAHGVVSERAHQTLYVSCIPPTSNRAEVLLSHFEKFGQVVDVRIPPHSDRAFVQFASREAAESALASPDAVLGNRFIRLSWANRDSILSNNVGSSPATGHLLSTGSEPAAVHSIHNLKGMDKLGLAQLNGSSGYVPETPAKERVGQVATSNGSQSSVAASGGIVQKKQEELELMREKIRQKQEALAKKRDEFRRKLERLSNQGAGEQGDNSEDQQASKRQKLDDNGDSNIGKEGVVAGGALTTAALRKSISGEIPHASPKLGKSPHPNMNTPGAIAAHTSPAAWGPARFKLDNRPSVLRVLSPLPPTLTDVSFV
jgi:RNA-binding protein 26